MPTSKITFVNYQRERTAVWVVNKICISLCLYSGHEVVRDDIALQFEFSFVYIIYLT